MSLIWSSDLAFGWSNTWTHTTHLRTLNHFVNGPQNRRTNTRVRQSTGCETRLIYFWLQLGPMDLKMPSGFRNYSVKSNYCSSFSSSAYLFQLRDQATRSLCYYCWITNFGSHKFQLQRKNWACVLLRAFLVCQWEFLGQQTTVLLCPLLIELLENEKKTKVRLLNSKTYGVGVTWSVDTFLIKKTLVRTWSQATLTHS